MPQFETAKHNDSRLFFLDWVRILAFFLLIFYHVGMYYVSWGYHVKSVDASHTIEPLMQMSSPWRLGLLFMISGVASRFMLDKISLGRFLGQRSVRLLLPLVFGMLVVVPIQPYAQGVTNGLVKPGFGQFLLDYWSHKPWPKDAFSGWHSGYTWNHLWYLAYLWVYTGVLALLVVPMNSRIGTKARESRMAGT